MRVSLIQPAASGIKTLSTFHPKFTYPIFGEEEHIFGYQNLNIHLRFAAHDLRSNLHISYDSKFRAVGETSALDLHKTLRDWIPKSKHLALNARTSTSIRADTYCTGAFQKQSDYESAVKNDQSSTNYTPPGRLVHSYMRKGRTFEVWAGSLHDPTVKELLDRIQIFISFFIEGGTPLNTTDVDWTMERWTVYFVYEKLATVDSHVSPYSFAGYATTYRFYSFTPPSKTAAKAVKSASAFPQLEPISVSELPSRLRISQFLILPPHQRLGHGSTLYNTIFDISLSDPKVHELTVEDPNEEFDLIRDINDYSRLSPEFLSSNLNINASAFGPSKRPPKRLPTSSLLPIPTLSSLRHKYKIAPRQFSRLTEMYLLSLIPRSSRSIGEPNMTKHITQKWRMTNLDDRMYYWWRMIVKQRIYKKNKDALIQLEVEDRFQKLEETVMMQEGEYELLLAGMADRKEKLESEGVIESGGSATRKRKLVVEDDEDEGGEEDEVKRTKV